MDSVPGKTSLPWGVCDSILCFHTTRLLWADSPHALIRLRDLVQRRAQCFLSLCHYLSLCCLLPSFSSVEFFSEDLFSRQTILTFRHLAPGSPHLNLHSGILISIDWALTIENTWKKDGRFIMIPSHRLQSLTPLVLRHTDHLDLSTGLIGLINSSSLPVWHTKADSRWLFLGQRKLHN